MHIAAPTTANAPMLNWDSRGGVSVVLDHVQLAGAETMVGGPRLGFRYGSTMTNADAARVVTAPELVNALAGATGSKIEIARNGGGRVSGVLVRADLGSAEADGRTYPVVHLLINRVTRDGSTPVIVSLLTGAAPDEDFFWPACPIEIRGEHFQLH